MNEKSICHGCMEQKPNNEAICPLCGYKNGNQRESTYLQEGETIGDRYIIGKLLGHGGFGITYLGFDSRLEMKVAIKEYLPSEIATRGLGETSVTVFTGEKRDQFNYGLERFLDEARLLARYQTHPCIVSALDFFQENNTAYLIMEYIEGIPADEYQKRKGGKISFDQAVQIMMPVMDALREVHKQGIIHRDISPDNIYITQDKQVKLLDFGAARHALGEKSKSLSVVLKRGYAPVEQYSSKGNQGPWTDVYCVAATIYRMITGMNPAESIDRIMEDDLIKPSAYCDHISPEQEVVLLKALAVKAEDRYQRIEDFQHYLFEFKRSELQSTIEKQQVSVATSMPIEQYPKVNGNSHGFIPQNERVIQKIPEPIKDIPMEHYPINNKDVSDNTSNRNKMIFVLVIGFIAISGLIIVMISSNINSNTNSYDVGVPVPVSDEELEELEASLSGDMDTISPDAENLEVNLMLLDQIYIEIPGIDDCYIDGINEVPGNGYLLTGTVFQNTDDYQNTGIIIKLDSNYDYQWHYIKEDQWFSAFSARSNIANPYQVLLFESEKDYNNWSYSIVELDQNGNQISSFSSYEDNNLYNTMVDYYDGYACIYNRQVADNRYEVWYIELDENFNPTLEDYLYGYKDDQLRAYFINKDADSQLQVIQCSGDNEMTTYNLIDVYANGSYESEEVYQRIDDDWAKDIMLMDDGGFLIMINNYTEGMKIVALNQNLEEEWEVEFSGDYQPGQVVLSDYYMTHLSSSYDNSNMQVTLIDFEGNIISQDLMEGSYISSVLKAGKAYGFYEGGNGITFDVYDIKVE